MTVIAANPMPSNQSSDRRASWSGTWGRVEAHYWYDTGTRPALQRDADEASAACPHRRIAGGGIRFVNPRPGHSLAPTSDPMLPPGTPLPTGCQCTSAQLARFADRHNVARSVARTGVCWDNAAAESFWANLKVEFYDRYLWLTRVAAKLAVGDWIERVYNRRRRHSALGMISPVEYKDRFTQTAQAA